MIRHVKHCKNVKHLSESHEQRLQTTQAALRRLIHSTCKPLKSFTKTQLQRRSQHFPEVRTIFAIMT